MSKLKEKYQQQILFDEGEINESLTKENTPQIIVDERDCFLEEQSEPINEEHIIEAKKPSWLWRSIAAVFAVLVGIETVQFFITGFNQSPIIAGLYGVLLLGLSVVCGRTLWREYSGLRQFKHLENLQQQARDIINDDGKLSAANFCEKLNNRLPVDLAEHEQNKWHDIDTEEYNEAEIMQLYSRTVLSKVDQKALAEVAKFSTESVVLVALSPIAIIDMLIMLWRNLRLVNKIAALYGLKLGYWSRVKLIKQVIFNMAYAGASELVADLGAELLGAELLGKLSARMAQGLGAGMLTARLGLKAMYMCRPIPFDDEAPKLAHVRQKVVNQVQSLITKKR
jgi:putative membrane protein